jgi:hypothetical protein
VKRKFKILFVSMIVIAVTLNLGVLLCIAIQKHYTKVLFEQVKDHDKQFVYETYTRALNAVMYVDDPKDTAALITYYSRLSKLDTATNYINFKIQSMRITLYKPIYVYQYLKKGSQIVELIDFNTKCWGYIKGYVYLPTTHAKAPADSLIKQEELYMRNYNSNPQNQLTNRIYKKINPYGWYCDN